MKNSFFQNLSKLLNKELMAFIKTDLPEKSSQEKKKVSEIFLKVPGRMRGLPNGHFFELKNRQLILTLLMKKKLKVIKLKSLK